MSLLNDDKPQVIYEFIDTSPTDYTLAVRVPVKGKLMEKMYAKVKAGYKKKRGDELPDASKIESFPVDERMLQLMKTAVKRYIKEARKQIEYEHQVVLTQIIPKSGFFHKLPDGDFIMELKIEGLYHHD